MIRRTLLSSYELSHISNYSRSLIAYLYSQGLRINHKAPSGLLFADSTYLSFHIQISNKTSHDGICNFALGFLNVTFSKIMSGGKVKLPSCSLLEALYCTRINT